MKVFSAARFQVFDYSLSHVLSLCLVLTIAASKSLTLKVSNLPTQVLNVFNLVEEKPEIHTHDNMELLAGQT